MIDAQTKNDAKEIARILESGKGDDAVILDISDLNSTVCCFVIATTSSAVHCQGLRRQVEEYARAASIPLHEVKRKSPDGDEWSLVDLGSIVVHLMSKDARAFYDLEALWHKGLRIDFYE